MQIKDLVLFYAVCIFLLIAPSSFMTKGFLLENHYSYLGYLVYGNKPHGHL